MIYNAFNNQNTANETPIAGKHRMVEDHFHLKDRVLEFHLLLRIWLLFS